MKKFVFKYESILKKYQSDEEKITNELHKAQRKFYQLSKQKKQCMDDEIAFKRNFYMSLSGGISAADYRLYENGQNHYRQVRDRLEQKISEVQIEIVGLKKRVLEAMKKRKMMEKLKEKELEIFLENIKISENKIIEEIVNYQSFKKGGKD